MGLTTGLRSTRKIDAWPHTNRLQEVHCASDPSIFVVSVLVSSPSGRGAPCVAGRGMGRRDGAHA
eukprot:scaffold3791_cov390-Prasinococcus_capsulatus_cf.AAC.19